ncbi:MAG: phospholipase D-like domain-containing protein [Fusobacterium sp.]|uniref:phospholipase D-like domain-containing protein n=1 Tax=Fusobacterium sp. TaxID=68766 RepID=UPI0026DB7596|nr:phospholipase D-like domain-containing protein [Fusobacterium sp.]MDO4691223.1 phospholipase D-like domain-containing protein [Fusobacterium sp.]
MKLSEMAIRTLIPIITGDCGYTPYLNISKLDQIFSQISLKNSYNNLNVSFSGELSRKNYTETILFKLNNTRGLKRLIELIVDPRLYISSDFDLAIIVDEINNIITHEGYRLESINGNYKIKGEQLEENNNKDENFEDIKAQIMNCIKKANYCIWLSILNFNDLELIEELLKKKKEGLNIRVIIAENDINPQEKKDYKHFEIIKLKPEILFKNIMNKGFCIIDFKTTICFSFNWEEKTQWNYETVEIINSGEFARKNADIFINMIKIHEAEKKI